MPKVVINSYAGGFGLSEQAKLLGKELSGDQAWGDYYFEINRSDPILVKVVETLGSIANGEYANLKIVNIPDSIEWYIGELYGKEWVYEKHRIWA